MAPTRTRMATATAATLAVTIAFSGTVPNRPAHASPGYGPTPLFFDEFNQASLDAMKWDYRTDGKHWSQQQAANVTVSGGRLHIALRKQTVNGYAYTGGGIISKAKMGYGRYEASCTVPATKGWHSTFWTMDSDGRGGTGASEATQEVDVIEHDSVHPRTYSANYHRWNPGPHIHRPINTTTVDQLSARDHVFAVDFQPWATTFYRDGIATGQTFDISKESNDWQNVWLTSIASRLGPTDRVDDTGLPAEFSCDWVRYYPRTNLLANPTFDLDTDQTPVSWTESGNVGASFAQASPYTKMGLNRLAHTSSSAFKVTTAQTRAVPKGTYTLRAMVKASSSLTTRQMRAGGRTITIPVTSEWRKVEITDITVTDHSLTAAFSSAGPGGSWMYVDEVQLLEATG